MSENIRCPWCQNDSLYQQYHDTEWGVPLFDDQKLFEFLLLEGAQAGLSWITVLRKRENYLAAFDQFDPHKMIRYNQKKIESLLQNPGIIRNRLKVNAFISNAHAYLAIKEKHKSFSDYLWQFTNGKTISNSWTDMLSVPATSPQSDAMAKQLKKDNFRFVGSTICYALMQATGMVNDHLTSCYRHSDLTKKS